MPRAGRPPGRPAARLRRRARCPAGGPRAGLPDDIHRGQHRRRRDADRFPPADRLLAAIAAEAERPLDGWLDERRIGLRDVAEANAASGRWERRPGLLGLRPRYTDRHVEQTGRDLVRSASDWPADASPEDACVTVVAAASGLLDRELGIGKLPSPAVLAATGDAGWLCPTVVEHLARTAARYRDQAGALGLGSF